MSLGAPRRKRAKSEKTDDVAVGVPGDRPPGEMKRMEPRRGDGPYTMARLARAVARLVDGQGALLARIDALEKALADRERQVVELEAQVKSGEEKRGRALERIDQIIDQLDELEGRAESAAFAQIDGAPRVSHDG